MLERMAIALSWTAAITTLAGACIWIITAFALRRLQAAPSARYRLAIAACASVAAVAIVCMIRLVRGDEVTGAAAAAIASGLATPLGEAIADATRASAWTYAIAAVLGAGALTGLLRLANAWHAANAVRARATMPASPAMIRIAQRTALRLRVPVPAIAYTHDLTVPTVCGVLRPVVLMPVGVERTIDSAQLELIIAHELAHIRRRDPLVNVIMAVLEAVMFFNIPFRFLCAAARTQRELACDAFAAAAFGKPLTLARALERLESSRTSTRNRLALAASDGPLLQRVRSLVAPVRVDRRGTAQLAALCAALIPASIAGAAAVPASLVDETIRMRAPASQHIQATDDAGAFTVSIVRLRAVGATFDGRPFPAARIRQRGANVRFVSPDDSTFLTLRLRPDGGVTWTSR
jgi:beta-lactamase regulating signal transducer with metallopeptidase domain